MKTILKALLNALLNVAPHLIGSVIKNLFGATLLLMACYTPLSLAGERDNAWYLYGEIGGAKTNANESEVIERFNATNTDANLISLDNSGVAGGAGIGYYVNDWFNLELGYTDLGQRQVEYTGTVINEDFYSKVAAVYPESAQGIRISAQANWHINDDFVIALKVGALRWRSSFEMTQGDNSIRHHRNKGTDIWYGGEVNHQLNKDWQLFATVERYHLAQDKVDFIGIGARYFIGGAGAKKSSAKPLVIASSNGSQQRVQQPSIDDEVAVIDTTAQLPVASETNNPITPELVTIAVLFEHNQHVVSAKFKKKLNSLAAVLAANEHEIIYPNHLIMLVSEILR